MDARFLRGRGGCRPCGYALFSRPGGSGGSPVDARFFRGNRAGRGAHGPFSEYVILGTGTQLSLLPAGFSWACGDLLAPIMLDAKLVLGIRFLSPCVKSWRNQVRVGSLPSHRKNFYQEDFPGPPQTSHPDSPSQRRHSSAPRNRQRRACDDVLAPRTWL